MREATFLGAPRFEYVRPLGAGGMGVVHEVFDTERRVRMALKTLHTHEAEALLSFKREFRELCDLRHPNLVSLGDLVEVRGEWFFTMELVEGTDFLSHVRPHGVASVTGVAADTNAGSLPPPSAPAAGAFDEGRVRDAFRQLAAGLSALHRAGKLHRDLKPSNVLVTLAGRVVLLDFGLVTDRAPTVRTSREPVVGTVLYMAPEQALREGVGPGADWYAFGTMLFQALTGTLPFDGPSMVEVLLRKSRKEAPSPLDLAPDAPRDLVALCRALLRPDPRTRADEAAIRAALAVDDDPRWVAVTGFGAPEHVFVGREGELAALRGSFEEAALGESVAVIVEGESGVGKSALVDTFVRRLRTAHPDVLVLRSRCREQEACAYRAFDGWMDDLSRALLRMDRGRVTRMASSHTAELLALFPCLAAVRALKDAADGEARDDLATSAPPGGSRDVRLHGFAATIQLLRSVAARRPLVAVIDDVQWADKDSLLLLEDLLSPRHVPAWCLIVTERRSPGEEPCAARRLLGGAARVVSLGGLRTHEARELARHLMAGESALAPRAVDQAVEDSHGHPLFLSQLVVHLARSRPSARGRFTLDDALWAEVEALPATAARVLGILAVAGGPVALGSLAAAAEVPPEVFVAELSRLRASRLARIHGSRRDDTAEPYHNRVRETLLARLHGTEKQALHGALALALERTGAEDDRIAAQWRLAGDEARSVARAQRAIDTLERGGAFDRAAEMARLVLEVSDPEGLERFRWLVRLGENLGRAGRPKDSADAFLRAAAVLGPSGEQRLDLERRASEQLLSAGYMAEGLALARKVLGKVGLSLPEGKLAAVGSLLWHQWWSRRVPLGLPPAEGLSAERAAAEATRLDVRWTVGSGLSMVDTPRGTALLASGLRSALSNGDPLRRARALCGACISEASSGDPDRARALADAARAAADEGAGNLPRVYALLAQAGVAFLVDKSPAQCVAPLMVAEALWAEEGRGAGWETAIFAQYMCWSLWWAGDLVAFRERWERSVRAARLGGHRYLEAALRIAFPWAHLMDDRPEDARLDGERALAAWTEEGREEGLFAVWRLEARTWTWLYAGDGTDGGALAEAWSALDRSLLGRVRAVRGISTWLSAKAAVAATFGARVERGPEATKRAVGEIQRRAQAQWRDVPYSRKGEAGPGAEAMERLLLGRREAAVAPLRATAEAVAADGMAGLAAAWRALLGEAMGGEEGAALRAEALQFFSSQGVRRPEAFARMLVPVRVP